MSVDTAAIQDVERLKFGSGFQRPSIEADLQRYVNALPSLGQISESLFSSLFLCDMLKSARPKAARRHRQLRVVNLSHN